MYLLLVFTFYTCTIDLFSGGDDCKFSFSPPKWIIGAWHTEQAFITDFIFTKSDVKNITSGSKKAISLGYDLYGSVNCEHSDSSSETVYTVEVGTRSYKFTKIDNNTILYSGSFYTKQ